MPRDYYEVLGRPRGTPTTPRSRSPSAGWRGSCIPTSTSTTRTPRRSSRRPPRPTRCCPTPQRRATYDRYGHEGLRSGGYAPELRGLRVRRGHLRGVLRRRRRRFGDLSAWRRRASRPDPGRRRGGRAPRSTSPQAASGDQGRRRLRGGRAVRALPRQRRRAGHADRDLPALQRHRTAARRVAHAVRPGRAHDRRATSVSGDGRSRASPCRSATAAGAGSSTSKLSVDVPAGIAAGQRIRVAGRGHAGERGGPAGRPVRADHGREDPRFVRDGDDLLTAVDVSAPLAALGTTVSGADGRRRAVELEIPAGTQPHETLCPRRGHAVAAGRRPGDLRVVVNVVIPRHLNREQRELLRAARRLADRPQPAQRRGRVRQAQARVRRARARHGVDCAMIRLAVRVRARAGRARPGRAARAGAERGRGGRRRLRDVVEYAVYGRARRAAGAARPDAPPPAARWSRSRTHRDRRRLGRALARVPPAARARRSR